MLQNIYDNDAFFEGYMRIRERACNANDLIVDPAVNKHLPDLNGKTVLDLGCGYGKKCVDFANRGARSVLGIDISEKMLSLAKEKCSDKKITYLRLDMNAIDKIEQRFDFIYSGLAFHYVEDFDRLIGNIFNLLNPGGILLFVQEHPIITATIGGGHWNKDEKGERVSYTFSNYNQPGVRSNFWIVDNVIKYHRTMGEIVTTLAKKGFFIELMEEPAPEKEVVEKYPVFKEDFLKPDFLMIRARKIRV